MTPITLSLSVEDTNLVLEALGQLPFARVYHLIDSIGEQAGAQLAPAAETGPGPEAVRSA